jgi:CubicO group peptidase (beta-lactamase class C family)
MRSFSLAAASIAGALLVASSMALAQDPPAQAAAATPESPATPTSPQLTRADLEAWLDGLMPYALERGNIAGAVVVVVKDGQTLLQKGYGYADLEKRTPVDPERTLFRPGSVSKLFTWTAVMQQVERGKLDLDADVNTYLDFKIPPGPAGKPVRVRDLMTHTPGFEEAVKELIQDDESTLKPLGDVLKRWVPDRIFEAGKMPAYSNYGTALAGYLVERVSGVPFDDYIEKNILVPLGMSRSSFRQPLPKALKAAMSQGYEDASGEPKKYELINLAPAGSLAATGADMARFMIAHLQKGAFGDKRILAAETAEQMHGTPLTIIPNLKRMMLGFYESNTNGRRIVSHGGDTQYFHSDLHLYLDEGVGYFISVNSLGKEGAAGNVRSAFFKEFSNRYFPGPAPAGEVDKKTAEEHARLISGTYITSRRIDSSFLSVLNVLSPVKVTVDDKGFLMIPQVTGLNGEPVKWREVEPFVWAEVNGKERLAAEVVDGRVTRFSVGWISPFIFFERAPAAKAGGWVLPAAAAGFGALTLTWLLWPVAALVRRHYRQPLPFGGVEARAYRWVRVGALATTLAVAAWIGLVFMMFDDLQLLSPRLDPWIRILHVAGTIAVLAGLALAAWHLWVVWRARRRWLAKIWSVVLVLASLVLTWIAYAYHLFGIGTDY